MEDQQPRHTAQIQADKLGTPGFSTVFMVVPIIEGDNLSADDKLHDNSSRTFEIKAKLTKHNAETRNIDIDFSETSGDSFIVSKPGSRKIVVSTAQGSFEITTNPAGRLSVVKFSCKARSGDEAKQIFNSIVMPFIDSLCFYANVPIIVSQVSIEDMKHSAKGTFIVNPHHDFLLNDFPANIPSQLFPTIALYREAKNSSSCYYKFLCYYKTLEGFIRILHNDARKLYSKQQMTFQTPKIILHGSATMHPDLQKYVGKSAQKWFDELLTPTYRHSVAHFSATDVTPLIASDATMESRYNSILESMETCCREYIHTYVGVFNVANQAAAG